MKKILNKILILALALALSLVSCTSDKTIKDDINKNENSQSDENNIEYYEAQLEPSDENNWGLTEANVFFATSSNAFEYENYEGIKNYKLESIDKTVAINKIDEMLPKVQTILDKQGLTLVKDDKTIKAYGLNCYKVDLYGKYKNNLGEFQIIASPHSDFVDLRIDFMYTFTTEVGKFPNIDLEKTLFKDIIPIIDDREVNIELWSQQMQFFYDKSVEIPDKDYRGIVSTFYKDNKEYSLLLRKYSDTQYDLYGSVLERYILDENK